MRPPAAAHTKKHRLREPASALGMNPMLKRNLDLFRHNVERILNGDTWTLSFEDTYRAGYNLCMAGEADVLCDLMEIAVKHLRRMSPDMAKATRQMLHDVNLFCESNWTKRLKRAGVNDMGRLSLP